MDPEVPTGRKRHREQNRDNEEDVLVKKSRETHEKRSVSENIGETDIGPAPIIRKPLFNPELKSTLLESSKGKSYKRFKKVLPKFADRPTRSANKNKQETETNAGNDSKDEMNSSTKSTKRSIRMIPRDYVPGLRGGVVTRRQRGFRSFNLPDQILVPKHQSKANCEERTLPKRTSSLQKPATNSELMPPPPPPPQFKLPQTALPDEDDMWSFK